MGRYTTVCSEGEVVPLFSTGISGEGIQDLGVRVPGWVDGIWKVGMNDGDTLRPKNMKRRL